MDCSTCKDRRIEPVTYLVFESTKATLERTIRRLWVLVIILVFLLFGTNAAWVYYESQWEVTETTTVEADASDGGNAIANNGGEVSYSG